MEGSGNYVEVWDELLVEVAESNRQPYSFHGAGRFPFFNGSEFDWVHSDVSLLEDHA